MGRADRGRARSRRAPARPRAALEPGAHSGCAANLRRDVAEPVHQAVPDDRRAHARAARRLAGDGGADALPPRAGVRRAVRARARPAAGRVPHAQRRARVHLERVGRDGVGGRQPRPPRRQGAGVRGGQVRRALDPALRGLRRRPRALRAGLGRAARPGGDRPAAERRHQGRVRHAERDLDRHRARRPGDRRGHRLTRRDPRPRRRIRPRRRRAAAGRVGRRRRGGRLAEGADVPARAGVRERLRPRARVRGVPRRRPLLLRLEPHREEPAQGREPVHARGVAVPRARRRARHDRGRGPRRRDGPPPAARARDPRRRRRDGARAVRRPGRALDRGDRARAPGGRRRRQGPRRPAAARHHRQRRPGPPQGPDPADRPLRLLRRLRHPHESCPGLEMVLDQLGREVDHGAAAGAAQRVFVESAGADSIASSLREHRGSPLCVRQS